MSRVLRRTAILTIVMATVLTTVDCCSGYSEDYFPGYSMRVVLFVGAVYFGSAFTAYFIMERNKLHGGFDTFSDTFL